MNIKTGNLIDNIPEILPREEDTVIYKYIDSHDKELEDLDQKINDVYQSRKIDAATGDELDQIGRLFGELGRRRGRDDQEYRTYLKSIVQSFSGRGTKPGMKFAVAAGIGTTTDNITINEDFKNNSYTIRVENVSDGFIASSINDMAELADPSGVELGSPPYIILEGADIVVTPSSFNNTSTTVGLGNTEWQLGGSWQLGQ